MFLFLMTLRVSVTAGCITRVHCYYCSPYIIFTYDRQYTDNVFIKRIPLLFLCVTLSKINYSEQKVSVM